MKVRAKFADGKFGYYGDKRRYDGDVFDLEDQKHFSKNWMVKIDEPKRGKMKFTEAEAS